MLDYTSHSIALVTVRHLEMIVWLVGMTAHDIGSSIQSVVVACDLTGSVSCAVLNVVSRIPLCSDEEDSSESLPSDVDN